MKLRTEILLVFIVVGVCFISFSGIFYYSHAKKALIQQIRNQLESLSEIKERGLQDIINKRKEEVSLITNMNLIREQLYMYHTQGKDPQFREPVKDALISARAGLSNFKDIHILSREGDLIVSTDPFFRDKDYVNRECFKSALNKKKCVNDFYLTETFQLGMFLSGPVIYKNEIVGVVIVESDGKDILSLCHEYTGLSETGESALAKKDSSGRIIYISSGRFSMQRPLNLVVDEKGADDVMIRTLNGESTFFEETYDYRKEAVLASTRFIENTGWGLVTKIDKAEAFRPVIELRNATMMISGVTVGLLFIFSLLFAERFVRPIHILTRAAEKIRKGDAPEKVEVFRSNEIGILADTFNKMAESLTDSRKKIGEKVEELDRSNEALNRFAYVVSHDLKAPLNTMYGLIEIMLSSYGEKIGKDGEEMLRMIQKQSKKMQHLIYSILEYSKVGGTKGMKENVSVSEAVHNVVESINPPAHIKILVETSLPDIFIERVLVLQIFQNLIGNAVKFMDKSEGKIRVGCIEEQDQLKFYVADNGPGIEEQNLNSIFELFKSAHKSNHIESSGIGLAIVKKIVENKGGRVWVESRPGVGTVFYFTLPSQKANAVLSVS